MSGLVKCSTRSGEQACWVNPDDIIYISGPVSDYTLGVDVRYVFFRGGTGEQDGFVIDDTKDNLEALGVGDEV